MANSKQFYIRQLEYILENSFNYKNTDFHSLPYGYYNEALKKNRTSSHTHIAAMKIAIEFNDLNFAEYIYQNAKKLNQNSLVLDAKINQIYKTNFSNVKLKQINPYQDNPFVFKTTTKDEMLFALEANHRKSITLEAFNSFALYKQILNQETTNVLTKEQETFFEKEVKLRKDLQTIAEKELQKIMFRKIFFL